MNRSLREYSITILLLAGTLLIAYYPVLFEGRTLLPADLIDTMTLPFSHYSGSQHAYNSFIIDAYLQMFPLKYLTHQAYAHGNFAFWNPYILNGYPQYLEGMWAYNFVLLFPMSLGFPVLLLLPLFIAGLGMYALLRDYAVRVGVARIFATAYMLNSLFITQLLVHFIPASFSFAPFVLLFLHRYNRERKFKDLAWSSIVLALGCLAGNIQTAGFLLIVAVVYWIALWFQQRNRTAGMLMRPMGMVLGFGLALSAIMLLPLLELLWDTMHGGAFFSTSLLRSYSILQRIESLPLALTFFVPQLAGSIRGVTLQQAAGVYTQDFQGAIGFLPLFAAIWSAFVLWKKNSNIRPFVLLMVVGFVLPIATPLFRFLYHRFFIAFILGACGAGAIGLETMLASNEWESSLKKWTKAFAIGFLILIVFVIGYSLLYSFDFPAIERFATLHLLPRLQSSVFAEGNPTWIHSRFIEALDAWRITRPELLAGIVSALLALGTLKWKNKLGANVFLISIWTITTFQLLLFVHLWFPMLDTAKYPLYPETPETRLLESDSKNSRVYFYREVDTAKQFAFMDNENVLYGIPQATGYESMTPRSLYIYTAVLHHHLSGLVSPKFLGKFNIGTLVRVKPLPFDSLPLESSGALWIYKNPYVMPRAFLAHDAEILRDDTSILEKMSNDSLEWPKAYFTVSEQAKVIHTSSAVGDSVFIIRSEMNDIQLQARTRDTSYLIVSDTYYPGWEALLDGHKIPITRCNYAMRAIILPSGMHRVEFQFSPLSFRIGMWISFSALALLLCFWVVQSKRS